jgi:hypothetical protein
MVVSVANLQGAATKIEDEAVNKLRMTIRGASLLRTTPGTGPFRPRCNAIHPGHPAIVRASGTADVIDAVNFARAQYVIEMACGQ